MGASESRRAKQPQSTPHPSRPVQRVAEGVLRPVPDAVAPVDGASWSRVIVEVHPNLWLGSREAACSPGHLREIGVGACVNVTQNANLHPNRFSYLHLSVADSPEEQILEHAARALQWVTDHLRAQRGVLVYCHQGISRSATLVLALLLHLRSVTLLRAWEHVQRLRKVRPNRGFLEQLVAYETRLRGSPSVEVIVRKGKPTFVPVARGPTAAIPSHRVI